MRTPYCSFVFSPSQQPPLLPSHPVVLCVLPLCPSIPLAPLSSPLYPFRCPFFSLSPTRPIAYYRQLSTTSLLNPTVLSSYCGLPSPSINFFIIYISQQSKHINLKILCSLFVKLLCNVWLSLCKSWHYQFAIITFTLCYFFLVVYAITSYLFIYFPWNIIANSWQFIHYDFCERYYIYIF